MYAYKEVWFIAKLLDTISPRTFYTVIDIAFQAGQLLFAFCCMRVIIL